MRRNVPIILAQSWLILINSSKTSPKEAFILNTALREELPYPVIIFTKWLTWHMEITFSALPRAPRWILKPWWKRIRNTSSRCRMPTFIPPMYHLSRQSMRLFTKISATVGLGSGERCQGQAYSAAVALRAWWCVQACRHYVYRQIPLSNIYLTCIRKTYLRIG